MDDHRPGDPKAPHIFASVKKTSYLCGEMRCNFCSEKMASIISARPLSVCPFMLRFLQRRMSEASSPDASPSRAVLGQARRRHSSSVCRASKNTRFVYAKHTFFPNRSFRLTRNDHFQNSILTSAKKQMCFHHLLENTFSERVKNVAPLRRNAR